MKTVAALLMALMLAGCAHFTPRAASLRLQFADGVCSGTAVGRSVILTAAHCFGDDQVLQQVNGYEVKVLEMILDGKDHILVRVDTSFPVWAEVSERPYQGDRMRWFGNPAGEADMYREGVVVRSHTDMVLIDGQSFGGDSGSGLFDSEGRVCGVITGGKVWTATNGSRFALIVAFPLAFDSRDWKEIAH